MVRRPLIGALLLCAAACSPGSQAQKHVESTAPVASARPPVQPSSRVKIDWDSGKGTAAHPEVDPSPVGWYRAALPAEESRTIYLTFDDGPSAYTPQVLHLLQENSAHATFFIVGTQVRGRESALRRTLRQGNAIGNHTWDHTDLTTLPRAQIRQELARVADVAPTGACMRPPYGAINRVAGHVALQMGYQPVMWTGQAFDWKPTATASQIEKDIKAATRPGAVILLHDGGGDRRRTVQALSHLLPYWRQHGYTVEAIAACQAPPTDVDQFPRDRPKG